MRKLPIQLRGHIIDPVILQPQEYIGIEIIVIRLTRPRGASPWILILVSPNTEWGDAEPTIRIGLLDDPVQAHDDGIHIAAAPVIPRHPGSVDPIG